MEVLQPNCEENPQTFATWWSSSAKKKTMLYRDRCKPGKPLAIVIVVVHRRRASRVMDAVLCSIAGRQWF